MTHPTRRELAARLTARHWLISAIDVEHVPCVPLLQYFPVRMPAVTLLVFAGRYDVNELVTLAQIQVSGYFLWDDLESSAFPAALDAALRGTFAVTGRSVAFAFVNHHNGLGRAAKGDITLSEREELIGAGADSRPNCRT